MRVGVIGAGLAGLAAARELLEDGCQVEVFDKGRGPGGRATSRRVGPRSFDHGAQYFTARDPEFVSRVKGWLSEGWVARWDARLVTLPSGGGSTRPGRAERFVGVPRMSAIARALARDIVLHSGARVSGIRREDGTWSLLFEDGSTRGGFDWLVVAVPAPQCSSLLAGHSPLAELAASLGSEPCWAALVEFEETLPIDFDGAFVEDPVLAWIARDSSKPGRPVGEAWVMHSSSAWARAHLQDPPSAVWEALTARLSLLLHCELPGVLARDTMHWRHARPAFVGTGGSHIDPEAALVVAGDAFAGGRIEGAYLSGVRAARQVLHLARRGVR